MRMISQAEFSRMCGVSRKTICLQAKKALKDAIINDRVDLSHPAAVEYLSGKDPGKIKELGLEYQKNTKSQEKISVTNKKSQKRKIVKRVIEKVEEDDDNDADEPVVNNPPSNRSPSNYKKPAMSGGRAKLESRKQEFNAHEQRLIQVPENIRDFIHMTLGDLIENFGTDLAFIDWLKATKAIEDINEKRLKNAQTQGELVSRDLVKKTIIEPVDEMLMKLLTDGAKTISRRSVIMHDAGRTLNEIEEFTKQQMSSFIQPMKARVARAFKRIEG